MKKRNVSAVAGLSIVLVGGFWAACRAQAAGEAAPATQPAVTAAAPRSAVATTQPVSSLTPAVRGNMRVRLSQGLGGVDISGLSIRQALKWWSNASGVNLVVNWEQLTNEGIDADKTVDVQLRGLSAEKVLGALLRQAEANNQTLMGEKKDGYIEVVTKAYADAHPVLRMYDVDDLLVEVPDFLPPQDFDLNSALSNGNNNGNNGNNSGNGNNNNGGNSLFGGNNNGSSGTPRLVQAGKTKQERGDELAKLVRDVVEPTIWVDNGGQICTCRYFQGKLIVNAPLYVHDQIGLPMKAPRHS